MAEAQSAVELSTVNPSSEASTFRRNHQSLIKQVTNPYENHAPFKTEEVVEMILVGLIILPFRIAGILIVTCLMLPVLIAVACGFKLEEDRGCLRHSTEISGWRKVLMTPMWLFIRLILFFMGFWCINTIDHRRDKRLGNIFAVAPHLGLADILIAYATLPVLPSAVGRTDMAKFPASLFATPFQAILVDLKNKESKHACKDAIAHRAGPAWHGPPLLLFPEGSITNGQVLTQFKQGAFLPGQPITPVLLHITSTAGWDPTWVGKNRSPIWALRLMCHLANWATIEILDIYDPSEEERGDAQLFARNVRSLMAERLQVHVTEHAYDDVFFYQEAMKHGVGNNFIIADMKRVLEVDVDQLKRWLGAFKKADISGDGSISRCEFVNAIGAESNRDERSIDRLMEFFDTDGDGSISYVEFVQCLALLSGKCSSVSRAKLAFLLCDEDGSGLVPKAKLLTALDNSFGHVESNGCAGRGQEMLNFADFSAVVESNPQIFDQAFQDVRKRLSVRVVEDES